MFNNYLDSDNLVSFDGGKKPLKEAKEIASDISKYLAFSNERQLLWKNMLNIDMLKKYIEQVENDG